MFSKKKFWRALSALIIGGSLFFIPVADAEIYTSTGEYTMSKYETLEVAEQRAVKDAMRYAQEQAGIYIESYSRMKNFKLLEDEVITIASGVLKFVEKPVFNRNFLDDGSLKILALIKVEIDDKDIEKYLSSGIENRQQINSQLESLRQANVAQEKRIKELEAQISNIKTPQDEAKLKEKFINEDKIFLSNQKIAEGNKFWAEKNYNKALELFDEAIKLNPNNAEAYNGRGRSESQLGKYEKSIEDFYKAIELNPNFAAAYNNRGLAYYRLRQYQAALFDLKISAELDPNLYQAYYNLGLVYMDGLDKTELAIPNFDKAIELYPDYDKTYNIRGAANYYLRKYNQAIADYSKAIELNPKNSDAYNNRGVVYSKMHKYEQAMVDYSKAITINPQFFNPYFNRGQAYDDLKQYYPAILDFTKAIELNPKSAISYRNRAMAHYYLKQYEKQQEDDKKARELHYDGGDRKKVFLSY